MLAAWAGIIQIIDGGALIVGGALWIVAVVWLFRRGLQSNPLRGLRPPHAAPPLHFPLALIVGYFAAVWILIESFLTIADRAEAATLGSDAFMRVQMIDAAAKLLMIVIMSGVLVWMPARWHGVRRLSLPKLTGIALGTLLALIALMALQLKTGEILWRWTHPSEPPPVHPVLTCLHENAWGVAGTAMFAFSAIVIAPLAEEFFFRGLLAPALWQATGSAWLAAVLSGAAFGLIHGQPQDIAPLIALGIALAALRFATGSLAICVGIHALFNARTIFAALLAPELLKPE
ncbi:MAG: CPBP family intramembrane metalloprotease [Phycisphaerales bacterium]|nr:CPBP family intramembrane metalloprotease [Phycisphaerales bacterium]